MPDPRPLRTCTKVLPCPAHGTALPDGLRRVHQAIGLTESLEAHGRSSEGLAGCHNFSNPLTSFSITSA